MKYLKFNVQILAKSADFVTQQPGRVRQNSWARAVDHPFSRSLYIEFWYLVKSSEYQLPDSFLNFVSEGGTTMGKHLSSNMPCLASFLQHSSWLSSGSGVNARSWSRNCPMNTRSNVLWKKTRNYLLVVLLISFLLLLCSTFVSGFPVPLWNSMLTLLGFGNIA